jgi:hypothetical protein
LFFFWKKLKEDYTQTQIFTSGFYILLAVACGSIISDNTQEDWWFWFSLLGGALWVLVGILRFRLKVFETIDTSVFAALVLLFYVFLYDATKTSGISSSLGAVLLLILITLFSLVKKHYKTFSWYKSGKVGCNPGPQLLLELVFENQKPDLCLKL